MSLMSLPSPPSSQARKDALDQEAVVSFEDTLAGEGDGEGEGAVDVVERDE